MFGLALQTKCEILWGIVRDCVGVMHDGMVSMLSAI